jgi:hypothetical protein
VTNEYDVPLMVSRSDSNITVLKESVEAIEPRSRQAYIYHFGNWDQRIRRRFLEPDPFL